MPDQTLIEQHLPYGEPAQTESAENTSRKSDPTLKLFRLAGLSADEVALFASHYGVSDVSDFVDAIKRANLLNLAERPFDLKALIRVWLVDHRLDNRFEVLQRMIELQLAPPSMVRSQCQLSTVQCTWYTHRKVDPILLMDSRRAGSY